MILWCKTDPKNDFLLCGQKKEKKKGIAKRSCLFLSLFADAFLAMEERERGRVETQVVHRLCHKTEPHLSAIYCIPLITRRQAGNLQVVTCQSFGQKPNLRRPSTFVSLLLQNHTSTITDRQAI